MNDSPTPPINGRITNGELWNELRDQRSENRTTRESLIRLEAIASALVETSSKNNIFMAGLGARLESTQLDFVALRMRVDELEKRPSSWSSTEQERIQRLLSATSARAESNGRDLVMLRDRMSTIEMLRDRVGTLENRVPTFTPEEQIQLREGNEERKLRLTNKQALSFETRKLIIAAVLSIVGTIVIAFILVALGAHHSF